MALPVFAEHLARYGPNRSQPGKFTPADAREYCKNLAQQHYENFVVSSLLLSRTLRPHFFSLYSWCRWADDLADETSSPEDSLRLLDWWEDELYALYAGRPKQIVTIALQETISAYNIPIDPFLDLLVAFRQDQHQVRYETDAQLLGYCRHSANPVGRLVLHLGNVYDAERVKLSDSICTGLQLANFWQDIARDWQRGRLYIPRETLLLHDVAEAELSRVALTPGLKQLLSHEVERAENLLLVGLPLVGQVPRELQIEIELFARGGLAILAAIRKQGFDVWSRRPKVGKLTQLQLLSSCWWHRHRKRQPRAAE
jgi:squalene synthase HpnC